jgi:leader peptidase (prepilin peptidase) / N-methyltransferase
LVIGAAAEGGGPMTVAVAVACAGLGAALGPFLATLVQRVPRKEPVLGGDGSVASARLRTLISAAVALLFGASGLRFGADWALPAYLVLAASLLVVSVIDLEHYVIPNRIIYPTLGLSLPVLTIAAALDHRWDDLLHALVGGAAAWTVLLLVHLVSPRGMGFGDVRLAFVLGLHLGWLGYGHVVLGLFLGFLLGSVAGIALLVLRRRSRKEAIPFGPFLAAGGMLAVLVGEPLIRWYNG